MITLLKKNEIDFNMKKFLIIPILIFVYIFFINLLSQTNFQPSSSTEASKSGSAEVISIGQSIGISVRRPYIFGLIYLPVYIGDVDMGGIHDAFFMFIFILTAVLILIEIKDRRKIKVSKPKRKRR